MSGNKLLETSFLYDIVFQQPCVVSAVQSASSLGALPAELQKAGVAGDHLYCMACWLVPVAATTAVSGACLQHAEKSTVTGFTAM